MQPLWVYADFHFLPASQKLGVLNYDRVRGNEVFSFIYDQIWLNKFGNIRLGEDLNTFPGLQYAPSGSIFGCFADSLPDRWGRTLAEKREEIESKRDRRPVKKLSSLDYLLSVDDLMRMGGFRFKTEETAPFLNDCGTIRIPPIASIRELAAAADAIERSDALGELPEEKWLYQLLNPGTSLGGARPKANVMEQDNSLWIAKFPSREDRHDVSLWELFCHLLAKSCCVDVADSKVMDSGKRYHVFLTKRFDRTSDGKRVHFSSAMNLLGFQDGDGRDNGKGYLDIADLIVQHCPDTERQLEQLYRRVAFNICVGNADDHFRNHGFLLMPKGWVLSPAYDMNPSLSTDHCLMITETTNEASLTALSEAHDAYFLPKDRALAIIAEVRNGVSRWPSLAKRLHMNETEVRVFESRLNLFRV
jgi:serine/threonine-protein kinase HipA